MRFFDASAIVGRYVQEAHSTRVRRLLASGDVAVSRLSEVEAVSALARLAREGAISAAQRDRAVDAFLSDLAAWHVVEITPAVAAAARALLTRHALRSLDALQLGAALFLQDALGKRLAAFVAFDRLVVQAARAEQLSVLTG